MPVRFAYGSKMGRKDLQEPPVQPLREDRLFLKYPEKPPLKPTPILEGIDESGEPFSIGLEEHPIAEIIPRSPIKNINFKSLQIWLDNLGLAMYNPLLVVQTPDGEYHSSRNGDHRSRCLWEIGEPTIRVVVRKSSESGLKGIKHKYWRKWWKNYSSLNKYPTTTPYMFGLPKKRWQRTYMRYYPPLWHPNETLQKYFNEPRNDGQYLKDTLFNTWSFREIYSQWKRTSYRLDIIDTILKDTDITGKTLLDIGPYYGWATLMLLEEGASKATAIDTKQWRINVIRQIARTRAYPVKAICGAIQNYEPTIEHVDVILMLNVFHHILHQTENAWDILRNLIKKSDKLYLMMGPKAKWGILEKWNNNVDQALHEQLPQTEITPLLKTSYRNRVLYSLQGKTLLTSE